MDNIVEALKSLAIPIDSVKLDERNARQHPPVNIDAIRRSLEHYGQRKPIVVRQDDNIIEAGNGLWLAAKELGWTEIAAVMVEDDHDNATGYAIMDNQSALLADWEFPILKDLLEELDNGVFDMNLTGFDTKEIEDLMTQFYVPEEGLTDDDAIPEKVDSICKTGDLWQLGSHRLLCGDATVKADVNRLMGSEKADMVFTDPPYGVDYDGTHLSSGTYFGNGKRSAEKLANDNRDIFGEAMPMIVSILKADKCCIYLCFGGALGYPVYKAVYDNDLIPRALIIWNKNHAQFGSMGSQYKQKHEPILYLYRKGKSTQWFGANNEVTVWDIDRQIKNEYHLTQKPVALSERAIGNSSKIGDIVADLFGGSGSTLIACEKLGRRCYMMEIDEHYCDVIIERWQQFTGKKAERIDRCQVNHAVAQNA